MSTLPSHGDIIVAPATPLMSAALCVIRLSGTGVTTLVDQMVRGRSVPELSSNKSVFVTLVDHDGEVMDEGMLAVYRGPRSFTGEDTIELTTHGSPYIARRVIDACMRLGARMAAPGEYTQRAFLNGKLDLAQAEAVADLIAAQSSAQHDLAMRQMKGHLSGAIDELRRSLIHFASMIELENDFSEEDVSFADRGELLSLLDEVLMKITSIRASYAHGRTIKEGVAVALIGPPNAGKSTLLNKLLGEERAIVTDIPGTTRDVIEDTITIDGILYRFIDTAGLRETDDVVEQKGIERSLSAIESAHIVLWMFEMPEEPISLLPVLQALSPGLLDKHVIILLSKSDKMVMSCHAFDMEEAVSTLTRRIPTIAISAQTGDGIDRLKAKLHDHVESRQIDPSLPIISHLRHYEALGEAHSAIVQCRQVLTDELPSDLAAIDLRHAMHHLSEVTGDISTDDLLERIFREFCIGK